MVYLRIYLNMLLFAVLGCVRKSESQHCLLVRAYSEAKFSMGTSYIPKSGGLQTAFKQTACSVCHDLDSVMMTCYTLCWVLALCCASEWSQVFLLRPADFPMHSEACAGIMRAGLHT